MLSPSRLTRVYVDLLDLLVAFALGGCLAGSLPGCARREAPKPQASRGAESRAPVGPVPSEPPFRFQADAFADVRVLRYKVHGFDALGLQQKQLAYALHEATLSGRDARVTPEEKQNLRVRRTLEALATSYRGDRNAPAFQALLTYAKRVWFSEGLSDLCTRKPLAPEGFSTEDFISFVRASDEKRLPLEARGESQESVTQLLDQVVPLVFQAHGAQAAPPSAGSAAGAAPSAEQPTQDVWLERIRFLEQAREVAENETQAGALSALLAFYRTGQAADWERYRDAVRADTAAKVVPLFEGAQPSPVYPGRMRALLAITDAEASRRVAALRKHAQWFEDQLPISSSDKSKDFSGHPTRVLEALVVLGDAAQTLDVSHTHEKGWSEALFGNEAVLLSNLREAYTRAAQELRIAEEFTENARELQRHKQHQVHAQAVLAELRAVFEDMALPTPAEAVRKDIAPFEDLLRTTRNELIALYYLLDPKLVALNVLSSLEVGRTAYDHTIRDGLLLQLADLPLDPQATAPSRPAQLIARWAYAQGKADAVIERVERDGKSYVAVRDYLRLRALFAELLREIQRILREGSSESAHELLAAASFPFDAKLPNQVHERYQGLKVAPYVRFLDPELTPVKKADEVVDVRIDYQNDFLEQQLRYAARYTFLKAKLP